MIGWALVSCMLAFRSHVAGLVAGAVGPVVDAEGFWVFKLDFVAGVCDFSFAW